VLRSRQNARYDDDVLIAAGSAFHALATGNAMSHIVIRRVDGTRSRRSYVMYAPYLVFCLQHFSGAK